MQSEACTVQRRVTAKGMDKVSMQLTDLWWCEALLGQFEDLLLDIITRQLQPCWDWAAIGESTLGNTLTANARKYINTCMQPLNIVLEIHKVVQTDSSWSDKRSASTSICKNHEGCTARSTYLQLARIVSSLNQWQKKFSKEKHLNKCFMRILKTTSRGETSSRIITLERAYDPWWLTENQK